jgi:3' terminal RNA ribose 2'-O-methyltransferase Hen1
MLLTISTTHRPATDLGYLLHKNPQSVHERELPVGRAVMFFPEASAERCTFALHVDVDPIALVRGRSAGGGLLDEYVNDRPYAASSLLSVAMARALNSAMGGRSRERQALAETPLPLEITVTPLAARGGETIVEELFAPLGYTVEARRHPVDEADPRGGESPYVTLRLRNNVRLKDALAHLYVLVPVLDDAKHYFIGDAEVDKLLAKGDGWLDVHPQRELIVTRYLTRRRALVREALARLSGTGEDVDEVAEARDSEEAALEQPLRLNDQRVQVVTEELLAAGAASVVDLGCGEGRLLQGLLRHRQFQRIVGVDVSTRALERAEQRLKLDQMSDRQRERIRLLHGALTYRDQRLAGHDAAALVEVIEHIDPDRLPALESAVFEHMRPDLVLVTTPNREYNARFAGMAPGALRHGDHRFEWTRAEFARWTDQVASRFPYLPEIKPIGEEDGALGPPTQMAVFRKAEEHA